MNTPFTGIVDGQAFDVSYFRVATAVFEEAGRIVRSLQDASSFRERFALAYHRVECGFIEWGEAAPGAVNAPIGLYASKGMLRLLAALRAHDGQGEFVFGLHPDDLTSSYEKPQDGASEQVATPQEGTIGVDIPHVWDVDGQRRGVRHRLTLDGDTLSVVDVAIDQDGADLAPDGRASMPLTEAVHVLVNLSAAERAAIAARPPGGFVHPTVALSDRLERVRQILSTHGCECECEHHHEEHDEDCARCLACRIDAEVGQ